MSEVRLLVDFGSTFTKGVLVDLEREEIVAQARVASTVDTDIRRGLGELFLELKGQTSGNSVERAPKLACSSAAGGLRMVVIGLVPELTVDAGRKAAYNAGAKVVGTLSGIMDCSTVAQLEALRPDLILLVGGTDGGNKEVIVRNAELLAEASLAIPVVIAGNRNAAQECRKAFERSGREAVITENVMPDVNQLNIEPARETIRQEFISRIAKAKGIDKVQNEVALLMPTPNAVLQSVSLLAQGCRKEEGLGDLMVVDVGGATTDIYSAAAGMPTMPNVVLKGLPEPFIKRTVEGDLGVRHNAVSILELVGREQLVTDSGLSPDCAEAAQEYCYHVSPPHLPQNDWEKALDQGLAKAAVRLGVERHAGSLQIAFIPGAGETYIQTGKDLRGSKIVIGTGGPVIFASDPCLILSEALFRPVNPYSLKPVQPRFMLDQEYVLYALGLLATEYPGPVVRMAKKYLRSIPGSGC
jgi:uncharacterized protein (TIGR01319 family)